MADSWYTPPLTPVAVGFRVVIADHKRNEFRYYGAFKARGLDQLLRQLGAFGYLKGGDAKVDDRTFLIDILDEQRDIVQDYPLSEDGVRWLVRQYRMRLERRPRFVPAIRRRGVRND